MPESAEKDKPKKPSRIAALKKEGIEHPEMPECHAAYLVNTLFEIGPTMAAGMGEAPLSHTEIAAWQSNTGIELSAWETRLLRRASQEYLVEAQQATAPDRPAPWLEAPYAKSSLSLVAESLKASMRELAAL